MQLAAVVAFPEKKKKQPWSPERRGAQWVTGWLAEVTCSGVDGDPVLSTG